MSEDKYNNINNNLNNQEDKKTENNTLMPNDDKFMSDMQGLNDSSQKESLFDYRVEEDTAKEEQIIPKSIIRENIYNTDQNKKQIKNILSGLIPKKDSLKSKINFKKINLNKFNIKAKINVDRFNKVNNNKYVSTVLAISHRYYRRYMNAPLRESRFIGSFLMLVGLLILSIMHYNKRIPDGILPLSHISGVGVDGSISAINIPGKSDVYYEDKMIKGEYEVTRIVAKGDSFGNILKDMGIKLNGRHTSLIRSVKKYFNIRNIFVGQKIVFYVSGGVFKGNEKVIEEIKFILDEETSIIATWNKEEKKYKVQNYKQPLVESQNSANGEITSSLYKAMEQNGVKRGAINDFINLFSFDVDFQRDIRKGDSFDVGFSEYTNQEGNFVRSGNIRYAELSVQGIRKRYYKYKASSGRVDYYDSNGKSGRKALMKTPIEGARLSSSFGRRKHPVLGYTKIHKGTDFAAPRGTPIFAAGDGRIEYAGRNGSFGIYIRIRHNGSYKTAYAHMSGIAKGVRRGRSVRQGQVIGYVGTTGRSTGNHLHYEVYKNGRAINSRTMKLPSGKQLKGKELKEFKVFIKPMMRDGI